MKKFILAILSVVLLTLGVNAQITGLVNGTAPVSIAALRLIPVSPATIQVSGYYAAGDNGGATYVGVASSVAVDDGCSVINPTGNGGSGRWILQWSGTLNVKQCGAKLDGVANDYPALAAAYAAIGNAGGGTLYVPNGTLAIPSATSASLIVPANTTTQSLWCKRLPCRKMRRQRLSRPRIPWVRTKLGAWARWIGF